MHRSWGQTIKPPQKMENREMPDKKDYGSVYVCPNGCLGSKVPAICKICKEPMKEVKQLSPTMKGPTLDCSEFEGIDGSFLWQSVRELNKKRN